jgi:hypothetical protein
MPGMVCTARNPGSPAGRPRASRANTSISKSRPSIILRREVILAAYGAGRSSWSSSALPATPNRSLIGTATPHLASTPWTCALQCDRSATSLARCRTSSRSSRVAGGAIHDSGSRPILSRSAKSAASRTSFLTRRYSNAFTPRVRQVHSGAGGLKGVDRPIPAVRALQHHLRALARPSHHLGQDLPVVGNLDRFQKVTRRRGPNDHTSAPVKVDPDVLLPDVAFHWGLLRRLTLSTSSIWRRVTRSEAPPPAPSSHQATCWSPADPSGRSTSWPRSNLAGADEGDQMWCVDRAPAGLPRERHHDTAGPPAGPW